MSSRKRKLDKGNSLLAALAVFLLAFGGLLVLWRSQPQPQQPWPAITGSVNKNPSLNLGTFMDGYGTLDMMNTSLFSAKLNMLVSSGSQAIRLDMGFAAWLNNRQDVITKLNSFVAQIRESGKTFVLADGASESYRQGHCLDWAQFKQAWVLRVHTLAQLYHPDYYIVIKEPGWYVPMVCDTGSASFRSASDWANLTSWLASTVLSVSRATKVGISVDAGGGMSNQPSFYDAYLQDVEQIQSVSFIGFDIYGYNGQTNTQNFLQAYGAGNKTVWIAEAWSASAAVGLGPSEDVAWLDEIYTFAGQIHAAWLLPFYTNDFASYNLPSNTAQLIRALQTDRTPIFYEFQRLAS